jgi:hypothetical protein
MRLAILAAAIAVVLSASFVPAAASSGGVLALQQPASQPASQPATPPASQPSGQAKVDIDIHHGGNGWWMSPTWMAIGGLAVALLLVLLVMATRSGGGTTIVRG